jgi:hypothetical protein
MARMLHDFLAEVGKLVRRRYEFDSNDRPILMPKAPTEHLIWGRISGTVAATGNSLGRRESQQTPIILGAAKEWQLPLAIDKQNAAIPNV